METDIVYLTLILGSNRCDATSPSWPNNELFVLGRQVVVDKHTATQELQVYLLDSQCFCPAVLVNSEISENSTDELRGVESQCRPRGIILSPPHMIFNLFRKIAQDRENTDFDNLAVCGKLRK
ncbi:hypothetical protein J6590_101602 [Homalodisca vitripennis]|nr:hypothetical protein J6590_101602 [Homalodisca vitripennis]